MFDLRLPARLSCRSVVTAAVGAACEIVLTERGGGVTSNERFRHELVSAAGEAFNNVVLHAYGEPRPPAAEEVRLCIGVSADAMSVELSDCGASFDPEAVPIPDLESLPESGLGVFVIRSCTDEVVYQPGVPNRLIMVKRFPR